jgi:Predicted metal-dependent hydrolase of the TIM-barrel fold
MLVVDSDAHVMEPDHIWTDYIDAEFRDRAPKRIVDNGRVWGQIQVDGQPLYQNYPDHLVEVYQKSLLENYGDFLRQDFDAASLVRAMDLQGIDISYLYPSIGLYVSNINGQDPDLAYAITRAYNNWLAEFCSYAPERLRPVALVSLHRPEDARQELLRSVRELKMQAVMVRPNPLNGRTLGNKDFAPFWELCDDLDVAVGIHEGSHARVPQTGADRFDTHMAIHACCHPMEQMMAFVALFEGGVFQRHPKLRFGFLEAGCGWLPYLLWRLEGEFKLWSYQVPEVHDTPRTCFQRQCYITGEASEPYLPSLIDSIGADHLLFASDYPHPDHGFGTEIEELLEAPLPDETKKKILWNNAVRFYKINEASLGLKQETHASAA